MESLTYHGRTKRKRDSQRLRGPGKPGEVQAFVRSKGCHTHGAVSTCYCSAAGTIRAAAPLAQAASRHCEDVDAASSTTVIDGLMYMSYRHLFHSFRRIA